MIVDTSGISGNCTVNAQDSSALLQSCCKKIDLLPITLWFGHQNSYNVCQFAGRKCDHAVNGIYCPIPPAHCILGLSACSTVGRISSDNWALGCPSSFISSDNWALGCPSSFISSDNWALGCPSSFNILFKMLINFFLLKNQ